MADEKEKTVTRDIHENNIKAADAWRKAVKAGTFSGRDTQAIASLIGFLEMQYDLSLKEFEKASELHPEWGNSVEKVKLATGAIGHS